MIYYLATRAHLYTMRTFLREWGAPLRPRIRLLAYEDLPQLRRLPFGSYIFSDLERLAPARLEAAAQVHAALNASLGGRARLLNHPTLSLRRYELLRRLHDEGHNAFNVYRAAGWPRPARFPVFLRREDDHAGAVSTNLGNQAELNAQLAALREAGTSLDPLIVTEWLDTADAGGVYRKYSAFVIGEQVLPRHLFFSRGWTVKYPDLATPMHVREELTYITRNPHRLELQRIFRVAGIGYGRIDYSLHEGRIQVWEINTNPWVMSFADRGRVQRQQSYRLAWNGLMRNIAALDAGAGLDVVNPLFNPPPPLHHRALHASLQATGFGRYYGPLARRLGPLRAARTGARATGQT